MILAASRVHAHAAPAAALDGDDSEPDDLPDAPIDPMVDHDEPNDPADPTVDNENPTVGDPDERDERDEPMPTGGLAGADPLGDGLMSDDPNAVDELALDPFGLVGTAVGDPTELREIAAHHHRLSALGRIDLSVVWRRRWRPIESAAMAIDQGPFGLAHTDTVLVVATWRK